MGKVADNEKHKLKATFYNNIATSFIITGFVIPYLAFVINVSEAGGKADSLISASATVLMPDNLLKFGLILFSAICSYGFAMTYRMQANLELDKISD